jgi:hypothetical protein
MFEVRSGSWPWEDDPGQELADRVRRQAERRRRREAIRRYAGRLLPWRGRSAVRWVTEVVSLVVGLSAVVVVWVVSAADASSGMTGIAEAVWRWAT